MEFEGALRLRTSQNADHCRRSLATVLAGNLDGHADLAPALFGENERDDGVAADLWKAGALQRFRLDSERGDSMAGGGGGRTDHDED